MPLTLRASRFARRPKWLSCHFVNPRTKRYAFARLLHPSLSAIKKPPVGGLFMAEREGFEPSWDLRPPLISNQGRLATPASLQAHSIAYSLPFEFKHYMLALFHLIKFSSPRKSGAITHLRKHN